MTPIVPIPAFSLFLFIENMICYYLFSLSVMGSMYYKGQPRDSWYRIDTNIQPLGRNG